MEQTNKDCRFRNFDNFPYTNNICLLEDKIQDWSLYLFTISYGSYALDQRSGDGWISGWSQIFAFYQELLDAWNASALSRIIHNSQFKRKVSPEEQKVQKQDRFLRGRQIAYLIHEFFPVTGANDSVENYADLFTIDLRNDDIQEFDSKWDGISLSVTKIPPDDILEGLYKLRIRESEKFKTVLELHNMEIHQKKAGPDYHRLKTMVKRSIEQDLRNRNFGARNGNYERNAVVENQVTQQREQRSLGDCWQWKSNEQCSIDTAESFSKIFCAAECEKDASKTRSPRGWSPSGKKARLPCKDYVKRNLHPSIMWKMAPFRVFVPQVRKWIQFWVKSALMCIARLMNNLTKGQKRMVTKM